MIFLNALLLGGLLAGSIPIIIHLFHRRRFKVVPWGAMHLLEAVIKSNQRRIKIEQIILLIVRAAIPCLLALLMAQPVLKAAQTLLRNARASAVILLDDSYSMEGGGAAGANFRTASEESARIIESLPRGSEASVLLMGGDTRSLLDGPSFDLERLAGEIAGTNPGFGSAAVLDSLDAASATLAQMHHANRDLIVMSDFQKVSWDVEGAPARGAMVDRIKALPAPPTLTFFDVGSEVTSNVAVEALDFSRLLIGAGQKVQIRANLRNYGAASYPDLRVYFRANDVERSVSQISLTGGETGQVLFSHTFEEPGSHTIEVHADADPLTADNSMSAAVTVREKVPVLLVNGDKSPLRLRSETDFIEIALQPFNAAGVELADLISPRVIEPRDLNAKALTGVNVAVLANVRRLEDGQVSALRDFAANGGGLLIFPGNRIDTAWYNEQLAGEGGGLLPVRFESLEGDLKDTTPAASIISQHFEHPALELFSDPRNGNLSEAEVRLWFKLGGAAADENVAVLARLTSNDPLFVEKAFGAGRVIQSAIPADADWSNLPMRPFYLPLMQKLVIYLASTVYPPHNVEVGQPIVAFLPVEEEGKNAALVLPTGATVEVPIVKKGERGVVEYGETQQPGVYVLNPSSADPVHYVVTSSRRESDPGQLSHEEIAELAGSHGASVVRSFQEYKALDQTRRYGREIWKPLLWILLGLVFVEMFLAQRFGRRGRPA